VGLADDLRALSADDLAKLLTARPELADPAPVTMQDLANRASAPYSVLQCVSGLNAFAMQVLHGVHLLGGTATPAALAGLSVEPVSETVLGDELHRLRVLGLVGAHHDTWQIQPVIARVLGRPFGLGESLEHSFDRHGPADLRVIAENLGLEPVVGKVGLIRLISNHLRKPDEVRDLLARLPATTVDLLVASVETGSSVMHVPGLMQRMRVPIEAAQLLSHGLIVPLDWDQAEVPREISLLLLAGKPLRAYDTQPSAVVGDGDPLPDERQSPAQVVDLVSRLLIRLIEQPVATLKAGGLGVTSLKGIASELGTDQRTAVRLAVFAGMARLVAVDLVRSEVTVTETGHEWLELPPPSQWLSLVEGWRVATHELTDHLDPDHPVAPLRVDSVSINAPWRRARVMGSLERSSYSGPVNLHSLVNHVLWDGPSRWVNGRYEAIDTVAAIVGDLNTLGLLKDDQLTQPARAVIAGDPQRALELAATEFPPPLDTFTVQSDLTAIAPGELRPELAAELGVLADVESRGGATLLRFTEQSLTRAMDRGRSPEAILEFLRLHARPSIPQALTVLVSDVGRRHGRVRTGSASSYLRAEDPVILAAVVNSKKLAKARLRMLAPTVAVSDLEPAKLLKAVRDAGFAPMPEDALGSVIGALSDPPSRRVFQRPVPDRMLIEAERAWSVGLAGADIGALHPSTPVRKLADRLRAGRA
jgi:hypothetical protein